ncbi:MAG: hypothetical protein CL395_09470 [Acidiferrobacteraceae bacterium]|nr:hypothetical protein [Acidiferrobacteraceae bacterium]
MMSRWVEEFERRNKSMKTRGRFVYLTILISLFSAPASAQHMVWLDFGNFNLNSWASVNGNNPPTAADVTAVQNQIFVNMAKHFAPFDIYFSTFQPPNGRYTRLRYQGAAAGGLMGCAGPSCCENTGNCSGMDTWQDAVSGAEIYSGSFAGSGSFSGANATTARIARGLAGTGSHELGHVLDLWHCNAADDYYAQGQTGDCTSASFATGDQNVNSHIMSSGRSWQLTMNQRATVDRFFSVHASRRKLYGSFQARNHWEPLPSFDSDRRADLVYGRYQSPTTTKWYGRMSNGSSFGSWSTWASDAGEAGDIYLTGDVDGDGDADLVYGRFLSANTVRWYVRKSNGSSFGNWSTWVSDAGAVGDIFRLGDVDGDGDADLVYGRPYSSTKVTWYVRKSNGSNGFGTWATWRSDAGNQGDLFFLGDIDKDGDDDLVYGRIVSASIVTWYARESNGSNGFGSWSTWRLDAGNRGDLFYLGDTGGDGDADLNYGRIKSDTKVKWYWRQSTGTKFGWYSVWADNAGDAGDSFRLGDGDGDGRLDLFYARPRGLTSLTASPDLTSIRQYGRLSQGNGFGSWSTWRSDAGDEGDVFP